MKLRNKKTGEIIELLAKPSFVKRNDDFLQSEVNTFNSLAELNAEWEDYDEPKEYWFIDIRYPKVEPKKDINLSNSMRKRLKEIGNYFETKEEAEIALRKLKAWKRLKDKGFKLDAVVGDTFFCLDILISGKSYEAIKDDLNIVFGGSDDN